MNKLTILLGPPGSGKSSHSKAMEDSAMKAGNHGFASISQDDQGSEHYYMFLAHLTTGQDMVIDLMNFDKKQRDRYRLEAIKNGYTVNLVEFVVPRQVCYDRCMERQGHPTIMEGSYNAMDHGFSMDNRTKSERANSALDTYFSRYEEVTEDEGELLRIQYEVKDKKTAIMVDIDGTLANLNHRLHYVKDGNRDWGSFFRTVGEDTLYTDVAGLVDTEYLSGTEIVLCSGRTEDQCREATEKWLERNEIHYTSLKMRPAKNYKRDDITKAMLYRYEIKPYYSIKYVVDDRDQVVRKWRSMGLTCLQCRPGDF